jgi:hypothetical protein
MAAHFPPFDDDGAEIDVDSRSITYPPTPDLVSAPPHYRQGDIECIDAIRAALTEEEFRGYCKGNALKYIWRERHKGGDESVAKAEWYLERARRS